MVTSTVDAAKFFSSSLTVPLMPVMVPRTCADGKVLGLEADAGVRGVDGPGGDLRLAGGDKGQTSGGSEEEEGALDQGRTFRHSRSSMESQRLRGWSRHAARPVTAELRDSVVVLSAMLHVFGSTG